MSKTKQLIISLLLILGVGSFSLISGTPANNPVVPPSTWEGYGVDWAYRSLRVGSSYVDTLLCDGTLVVDTARVVGVLFADSISGSSAVSIPYIISDSLEMSGVWFRTGVQVDGGSFAIDDDVNLVIVNANHSTVDLPNPGGHSSRVITIKVDGSFADVTLRTGGGTIDGGATYNLSGTYKSTTVWSDGSDWLVLNEVVH